MPDPPIVLGNGSRTTPFSITVKWYAGWNGGPLQTFSITYFADGAYENVNGIADGIGDLSLKLTKGVYPLKSYSVTIKAQNRLGTSSSVSLPAILTPGKMNSSGPQIFHLESLYFLCNTEWDLPITHKSHPKSLMFDIILIICPSDLLPFEVNDVKIKGNLASVYWTVDEGEVTSI